MTAISLWRWRHIKWPKYAPREHHPFEEDERRWKREAWFALGCFLSGLTGFFSSHIFVHSIAALVCYILAYFFGSWYAVGEAWQHLLKKELDIHFLMIAVAAGAAAIGAWREGTLLLFLFSASGAMEHYAMGRTKKEISSLFRNAPKTARILTENGEQNVPVGDLRAGMRVLLTPGKLIPADLEVTSGESACDESNLTGEAYPVSKQRGDVALAGTMNLWGALEGRVIRPASESSLQKIIRLIREAQSLKAPSQQFTDRFGTGYTWGVLGLCLGMFFIWWFAFHLHPFISTEQEPSAFYRVMTLLVVASPCALVLSVPSAILSAIATGARRGILFRGGAAIETLATVRTVALDKTGTLTSGILKLTTAKFFEVDEERIRSIASTLAALSEHPLSVALRKALPNCPHLDIRNFTSVAGQGLQGEVDGHVYRLGSQDFVKATRPTVEIRHRGAEVWLAGAHPLARFVFEEAVRPESKNTLKRLHRLGLHTVMLTGDRQQSAEEIGRKVGVQEIRSQLLPKEKVAAIEELKRACRSQFRSARIAMIGDGVNDAPCIAAADVGVAMGSRGSDAALEQAEVVLMKDKLENFVLAYLLSRKSKAIISQNIVIALGTVAFMIGTTFLYPIPLAFGVAAHEGSTLLVVLNSLRLLVARF
ncbi:MAG: cadmium-translocating P-type ATPase [Verrucomicrobia bacterium]|nr:MAG: cadmium-translocating P-type ATPase [Verrucomicrobiota bacterium]